MNEQAEKGFKLTVVIWVPGFYFDQGGGRDLPLLSRKGKKNQIVGKTRKLSTRKVYREEGMNNFRDLPQGYWAPFLARRRKNGLIEGKGEQARSRGGNL